ncbi:MAG: prolyl oligopeptidase family serine peptidase [Burkholderiales bacterium]
MQRSLPRPRSITAVVLLAVAAVAMAAPPVAPVEDVRDVIHGVTVKDPYRSLEDLKSESTRRWLQGQGEAAAQTLARIEGRDAMQRRVGELAQATGDVVRGVIRMPGDRVYYLSRKVGEGQFKLVLRVGPQGVERVLVDPAELGKASGVPHALNYFVPSWDGKTLAYGVSAGGSEDASLVLLDIASGRLIGAPIPRVRENAVSWAPDSKSLTYNQLRALPAGAPETETFLDSTVFHLKLGRPEREARALFGPLVNPALKLDRLDVAGVMFDPGSRYMIARTTDTTVPEGKLFVAPVAALARGQIAWQRISGFDDKITDAQLRRNVLYLQTHAGAPRGRLLALDLARPELRRAVTVVPEPAEGVFTGATLGRTAIFAEVRSGFNVRLLRYAGTSRTGVDVAPGIAGSAFAVPDPAHAMADVMFSTSAWTTPSRVMRVDATGRVSDTGLRRQTLPAGAPEILATELTVASHDGARVPLAVLHRKGLVLDGTNPTLLIGYAAYGLTIEAGFDSRNLAWLEKGGVIAYANPRGSGAYGEAWHRAGFKATKPNTWKDGIACAKYLIDAKYASPKTLGIWGTSAGGIFVGRSVTTEPSLFAAAIFDVGEMDMVRAELSANGITNISEKGTVKDPQEFAALLEMSTYHHIEDGVAYPGVMLIHGLNDPRVDVWHSAKTAARLQAATSSGRPILLRLDGQAGHGIGATAAQSFSKQADIYSFLLWQFGKVGVLP